MIALALLAAAPVAMWLGQSILLAACGQRLRLRLDAGDAPPMVRSGGRAVTQLVLLAILIAYPLLIGRGIVDYYAGLFPSGRAALFARGAAVSMLFLCVLFGAWLASDQLRIEIHHSRRKWIRRLALLPATALFGAFVEELLFRGVLMADLLPGGHPFRAGVSIASIQTTAIAVGALVFAGAHYVRAVKRHWTILGHVTLGMLLCVAFLRSGSLWLPAGLHAGGIAMIMGIRPFVRYSGPAWLVGASIFPFAGIAGIIGLGMLTAYVWVTPSP